MTKFNFNGYMKVPLDQRLSDNEIVGRSERTGDWAKNSPKILKKPRLFTITAHLFDTDGHKAVTTIDYRGKGGNKTIAEAAIIAFNAARNGAANINMTDSYIIIRA